MSKDEYTPARDWKWSATSPLSRAGALLSAAKGVLGLGGPKDEPSMDGQNHDHLNNDKI